MNEHFNFWKLISRERIEVSTWDKKRFPRRTFSSIISDNFKLKRLINIRGSILVSFYEYKWILSNGLNTVTWILYKIRYNRESSGGKHRQDRSLGSYPAHLHLHPAKKRGESDRRSTVTRSLWAIVRARRCYHSLWAFRLDGGGTPQRGQSLRSRWIFNGIAEGIKKGGEGEKREEGWRGGGKSKKKKIYNYT